MASLRQTTKRLVSFRRFLAGMAAMLLACSSVSWAAVTVTADPDYPDFPAVFTTDPEIFSPAGRNIAEVRNLRQTFTNDRTFDVGEIILSLDIADVAGGLDVELFEVDDVLAATWTAGNPVASFSFDSSTLVETNGRLGITLTGGDIFTLPARTGPMGYGIQLSNTDDTTNIGGWRHTNSGTDHYVDGLFYDENGVPPELYRDTGVALIDANQPPAVPGDVDGDGDVDFIETDLDMISDLDIIAANFRQGPAFRTTGDLTGDGVVDLFDFREWKANFPGALPASFQFGAQAPEPASLLTALLALGAHGALLRRRG